ncbi:MAG: V-type ATP synthase subunit I [Candidatus Methanoperedens sp.]|nr:V-type ATP synthase subunit I [Candidatus Methanoperedens sp.]
MLKPTAMTKVVIAGTKDALEPTISVLHKLNVLHITDYIEENADFKIGRPLKSASKHSEHLLSLRTIASQLKVDEKEPSSKQSAQQLPSQIDEKIVNIHKEVSVRTDELRNLEFKVKEKKDLLTAVKPFTGLPLSLELYHGYETIKVYTGFITNDIEKKVSGITGNYEFFTGEHEKRKIFALFIPKIFEEQVQKLFQEEHSYVELKVPDLMGDPAVLLDELTKDIYALKEKETNIQSELEGLNKEYSEFILAADEYLSMETQKAEVPLRFATSANAFIIDGWVPTKKFEALGSELEKSSKGLIQLIKLEEEVKDEERPIELDNPALAKPFELLVETFAIPKYKEIDPALFLFFTYPLFYAIMLGDIGYGIIVTGMALVIRNKFKTGALNGLGMILLLSGMLSILLGVVYGEFFGFPVFNIEHEAGILGAGPAIGGLQLPVHRLGSVQQMLVVTLIIGILHILTGLILGFRNKVVEHDIKHAIYAKGSWIMILLGGVAAIAKLMPSMMSRNGVPSGDPIFIAGVILALAGIVLLIKGEGFISILEIPTILSNVLSYSRILAIGLSSAGIALAVNTLSMNLFIAPDHVWLGGGIVLALIGVVILFIGHLINLLLGILGPGLHSLRLQYVEFFTKFYEGGGMKYAPFGYNRKYTEE